MTKKNTKIQMMQQYKLLQDIDVQFSDLLLRLAGPQANDDLYFASALVSKMTTDEKDICLDLKTAADKSLVELMPEMPEKLKPEFSKVRTPKLEDWHEGLRKCWVVGLPGEYKPLILDHNDRLYLYRYWNYEQRLVASIKARLFVGADKIDTALLERGLKKYFLDSPTVPDWQKVAAFVAMTNNFCMISGGPGTGKTFTVTKILALLLEQNMSLRIGLAAPTGKAAARLKESIIQAKEVLACSDILKEKIPEDTTTVHRLLAGKQRSSYSRGQGKGPLPVDLLIVDEASMVSLMLMAKLIEALPDGAKIVLLGDKDQLASVEAGTVFGDICSASESEKFSRNFCDEYYKISGEAIKPENQGKNSTALADSIVELQFSYRFESKPAIGELSKAVNHGDFERALKLVKEGAIDTIISPGLPEVDMLEQGLQAVVGLRYAPIFSAETVKMAFQQFEKFRVLCSHRSGHYGVNRINLLIEKILQKKRLIDPDKLYYQGRPVMITHNDYNLKLFNGDMGIIWKNEEGELRACFQGQGNSFRDFSPARLPAHETGYAMTIHKSQGSEFENILMILPKTESPLLTRELIYTGLTRAKEKIEIWIDDEVFKNAVATRIQRTSGLQQALGQI